MPATTPAMNDLVRDYLAALAARDTDFVIRHSVAGDDAGYSGIHTGPGLVDFSVDSTVRTVAPLPPARLGNSDPSGWYQDGVAWLTDFPVGVLPSGEELPNVCRATVVLCLADGEWKVAHWHMSEAVGRDLSTDAPPQTR
jgi:hypothetical protein